MKRFAAVFIILALVLLGCASQDSASDKANRRGLKVEEVDKGDVVVFPQLGNDGWINSVSFSPDGKRIVSSNRSGGIIKIWDVETGREIRTISTYGIGPALFSPDGKWIVSGGEKDKSTFMCIFDAETGQESKTFHFGNPNLHSIALSPNGKRLVSGTSGTNNITIWDMETGRVLLKLSGHNSREITSVAFSPDGKRIVSGSNGRNNQKDPADTTIKIWDAETGRELRTLSGHSKGINSVIFSPDGKRLVSGAEDNTIKIWDAETGQELKTLSGHRERIWSVAYSPDGKRIVSGAWDATIKIWDAETGQELKTLSPGIDSGVIDSDVTSVAFSPDGKQIVSGDLAKAIKIWDVESGQELRTLSGGYSSRVYSVIYSPDGKRIIFGATNGTIKIWDAETGRELRSISAHRLGGNFIAASPDGKLIASATSNNAFNGRFSADEGAIKIWDMETGQVHRTLKGHPSSVYSGAFSPDGKRFVSGGLDKTIRIWDMESGRELNTFSGHSKSVNSVMFSPDGKQIVSGCWMDKTITIWDAETCREIRTISANFIGTYLGNWSAIVSPDGKWIVAGTFNQAHSPNFYNITIWDAKTGKEIRNLFGHRDIVCSIAFSPDGKKIVSGSQDNIIKLWDATTGRELRTLSGHIGKIESVAFSPDGKRIVSGSQDTTSRVWDVATGQELVQFVSFTGKDTNITTAARGLTVEAETQVNAIDGEWISITPDGYFNASPRGDRYLNVRAGNTVSGIDAYRSMFNNPDVVQARLQGRPDPASKGSVTIQQAAAFRPPTVTIQSPAQGSSVTTTTTNLSVAIADQNQPLQNIKLLVNGRLLGQDELGSITGTGSQNLKAEKASLSVTGNQKTISFQLPVNLDPGQNIIEVVAFNGYAESRKTVELTWRTQAGQQIALPNLWILAVGVNQYDNAGPRLGGLGNLNFCVSDAQEIIDSFKAQEGKRYGKVNTLLIADGSAVSPTARNIRDNLKFLAGAGPRDVMLFFLAGHGISDRTGRFFFLPRDAAFNADGSINPAQALSTDDIVSVLDEPGNRLVFIDACQSGGVDSNRLIRSLMNSNAFVFSASQGNEASLELADLKHGAFTYSIIRELQGAGAAKSAGSVGMLQLSGFVSNEVIRITRDRQHPKPYYQGYHDFPVAEIK